jgi:Ca-activated chloride channel homolog
VLFLTDGLPTIGEREEAKLRGLASTSNPHRRRVYTFGVGDDVNAPLLDALAGTTRAKASYVRPEENVEARVSEVYRNLRGPLFTSGVLEVLDEHGAPDTRLLTEILPLELPDLYAGDELSLLGRFHEPRGVVFRVRGDYLGTQRTFEFRFDLRRNSSANAFVPRLWASRRVALLIDEARAAGASAKLSAQDARTNELAQEITKLSTQYGIMTEYTSFLALEGTPLLQQDSVLAQVRANLRNQGQLQRSGRAAVSQSMNNQRRVAQSQLNRANRMIDPQMQEVQFTGVQQIGSRTFFKRGGDWVDSTVIGRGQLARIDQHVEFGSPEYLALLDSLKGTRQQAALSLAGDIVIEQQGRIYYVKRPQALADSPPIQPTPGTAPTRLGA